MKRPALTCGLAAFAGAAFFVGAADTGGASPPAPGNEYELAWDNGTIKGYGTWQPSGEGCWKANDFDVATLGATYVTRIRVFSTGDVVPAPWDGFRVALFAFSSVPGSMIWPTSGVPQYGRGSGSGWRWVDINVGWRFPTGTTTFLAAEEQYYTYPKLDP